MASFNIIWLPYTQDGFLKHNQPENKYWSSCHTRESQTRFLKEALGSLKNSIRTSGDDRLESPGGTKLGTLLLNKK